MGLWQQLYATYENNRDRVGIVEHSGEEPLAPVAHIVTDCGIEITVNQNGQFQQARLVDQNDKKTLIPVTQKSAGRSGTKPVPHPLCDQLAYFLPQNQEKLDLYIRQLSDWANSSYTHPMLKPILNYVQRKTIEADLIHARILDKKGVTEKDKKVRIRWIVTGLGEKYSGACWRDPTLFEAFTNYYLDKINAESPVLCMVSGINAAPAEQHLKGVVAIAGNAKLISANDKRDFTYRGRFLDSSEAETISYEASQKAHNVLKWLVANQGVIKSGRTFLCWSPEGEKLPTPMESFNISTLNSVESTTPSNYKLLLQRTLNGWKTEISDKASAVIAAFDAATSGRLSLTYYQELRASDFLDRLYEWDDSCCWWFYKTISCPSLLQIVNCALGTERVEKGKARISVDEKVMKQQLQALLACRINKAPIPMPIIRGLTQHASEPLKYHAKENRELILFTACAVIKKYQKDHFQEEYAMELEKLKLDRSYQFGRLLAIYEKMETDTYRNKDDQGESDKRLSNAIRLQSVYCKQPLHYADILEQQINRAYLGRLSKGSQIYYKTQISQIMEQIFASATSQEELNKPLEPTYLLGYYLQRQEFFKSHKKDKVEED